MPRSLRATAGQASVELVAVLPLVVLVMFALWQAVIAGEAAWSSAGAARAAARAKAVGGDELAAARSAVPPALRGGVRVGESGAGVRVGVAIPVVLGGGSLGSIHASAELPPQR